MFAALVVGIAHAGEPAGSEYSAMEILARRAIRLQMEEGWTDPEDYLPARTGVREHLEMSFPQMQPIYLSYADDELSTLILEELGLLSPTIH